MPPGMVDRALAKPKIGDERAGSVDLEQVADASAGVAVLSIHRCRQRFVDSVTSTDETKNVSPIFTMP